MILTVTLNAALDITYRVDALRPQTTHRVAGVAERPGGKGVNVARVLHALGEPVLATGLAGGATGARIRRLLAGGGVREAFVPIGGESRRTLVVAAGDDEPTGFWEPGPRVTADEWDAFLGRYRELLADAGVAVLSGSLPPGVPRDAYAVLVGLAADAGVATILDADGDPAYLGVRAGPDVVKPNARELSALHGIILGRSVTVGTVDGAVDAAAAIRALGARSVVASLGPDGLLAAAGERVYRAVPAEHVAGNPTGAGDAAVAGLARGARTGQPWPERLRDAVALSAAAVAAPVAGELSLEEYERQRAAVTVTELR
ncbi:tagatose 6-phosphate kinase [Micromonospora pattaloongensis]|uniref:Tagatose 6-phosphate kinase n=1 Tax=Micromonospora pattaloongensis TaxID=405436 RepID=A0A1H3H2B1_9ACTN|nr:tagatose 6-phosphate kinase [Micromonospora pattaloongensis]